MDVFEGIADERRRIADLVESLAPEQLATPSLCGEWTVLDVAGHLVVPLEVSMPRMVVEIARSGFRFDRANARLARTTAARGAADLARVLRERATSRFTPPGAGPAMPLADLLVHGLDMRWPLGIPVDLDAGRVHVALDHLVSTASAPLVPKGATTGLRLETVDVDWVHGDADGALVRGPADAMLLALTGRAVAFEHVEGDGVATLRSRTA